MPFLFCILYQERNNYILKNLRCIYKLYKKDIFLSFGPQTSQANKGFYSSFKIFSLSYFLQFCLKW